VSDRPGESCRGRPVDDTSSGRFRPLRIDDHV
jgi:hypothetical protein